MPRKRTMIPFTCAQCGKEELIPLGQKDRVYCSNACKFQSRIKPKDWKCVDCGTQLSAGHVTRCAPCMYKDRVGTISPKRLDGYERSGEHGRKIKRTCTICGADAWQDISYRKRTTVYCSAECRKQAPRKDREARGILKQTKHTCLNCGVVFEIPECWSKRGNGRFCSMMCYRRYTGESRPEANVRQCLDLLGIPFKQEHKMGRYRIDFFLFDSNIVLEVDAPYWHEPDAEKDKRRDAWMSSKGYRVVRVLTEHYSKGDLADMAERLASELHGDSPRSDVA